MLDHLITPFSSDTPVTSFPATTTIFPLLSLSTNSAMSSPIAACIYSRKPVPSGKHSPRTLTTGS